nr:unnamed protein product [Callosobruchus analis]
MVFCQQIQQPYGLHNDVLLKEWINFNNKIATLKNRRIFLLTCRREGLFPKHIENCTQNVRCPFEHPESRLGRRIDGLKAG